MAMMLVKCSLEQTSSNCMESVDEQNIEKTVDTKVATSENVILIPGTKKNAFLTSTFIEGGQTIKFNKISEISPIELNFKLGSPNGIDLYVTYKNSEGLYTVNLMNLDGVEIEYEEPSDNDDYGQASIYDIDSDGDEDIIAAFSNGTNSFAYNVFLYNEGVNPTGNIKNWELRSIKNNSLMTLEQIGIYVAMGEMEM